MRVLLSISILGCYTASIAQTSARTFGNKSYEVSNHLGNVMAVVSDRKTPSPENTNTTITFNETNIKAFNDYYPYGMLLENRNGSSNYRFGFQGQEMDDEVKGENNSVNYKYRVHDPRLGRFFAVDPLSDKYPHYSAYSFSGNRLIDAFEFEGLENITFHSGVKLTGALSGLNQGVGFTYSAFATYTSSNVSAEIGMNFTRIFYKKWLNNKTGGGQYSNFQLSGMIGIGDNSNLLGSNITSAGISFFDESANGGFIGLGYSYNINHFTGGLAELSNKTGGLLIRGSFGNNGLSFTMFNDVDIFPHFGGGTDYGITGTGGFKYTRGISENTTTSIGFNFVDVTGKPDVRGERQPNNHPRNNPNNPEGVYKTIGLNKDLNFGILGLTFSYSKNGSNASISAFRYGGAQGAMFQDPIHNCSGFWGLILKDDYTALFPYEMNDSKTGIELGF